MKPSVLVETTPFGTGLYSQQVEQVPRLHDAPLEFQGLHDAVQTGHHAPFGDSAVFQFPKQSSGVSGPEPNHPDGKLAEPGLPDPFPSETIPRMPITSPV